MGFESHPRQLIFLRKSDCLGCAVLLCLVVCSTLLASFLFLHLSLTLNIYNVHVCILLEAHVHVVLEPFTSNALAVYVVVPKEMVAIVTRNLVTWLHVTEDFHTRHVLTSGDKLEGGGEGGGRGERGRNGGMTLCTYNYTLYMYCLLLSSFLLHLLTCTYSRH